MVYIAIDKTVLKLYFDAQKKKKKKKKKEKKKEREKKEREKKEREKKEREKKERRDQTMKREKTSSNSAPPKAS